LTVDFSPFRTHGRIRVTGLRSEPLFLEEGRKACRFVHSDAR
jgi:hypothetical protein